MPDLSVTELLAWLDRRAMNARNNGDNEDRPITASAHYGDAHHFAACAVALRRLEAAEQDTERLDALEAIGPDDIEYGAEQTWSLTRVLSEDGKMTTYGSVESDDLRYAIDEHMKALAGGITYVSLDAARSAATDAENPSPGASSHP